MKNGGRFTPASALHTSDRMRDSAKPAGGSLGALANQGGTYTRSNAADLPKLMGQGPELLYKQPQPGALRTKLGQ